MIRLTEKRFTFNKDTVAINLKTPIVYNNEKMSIGEVLEMLNNLYDENEQLKNELEKLSYANEDLLEEKRIWKQMSDEYTKLSYENEQLNLLSNLRGEMVSFATSLIQDMGSEEMLKMWNDFKEVMYQKWKKGD